MKKGFFPENASAPPFPKDAPQRRHRDVKETSRDAAGDIERPPSPTTRAVSRDRTRAAPRAASPRAQRTSAGSEGSTWSSSFCLSSYQHEGGAISVEYFFGKSSFKCFLFFFFCFCFFFFFFFFFFFSLCFFPKPPTQTLGASPESHVSAQIAHDHATDLDATERFERDGHLGHLPPT